MDCKPIKEKIKCARPAAVKWGKHLVFNPAIRSTPLFGMQKGYITGREVARNDLLYM